MVEEHNTDNLHELNRIISEHPSNEKDTVIKYERLLGQLAPLRAFGDLRYRCIYELLFFIIFVYFIFHMKKICS